MDCGGCGLAEGVIALASYSCLDLTFYGEIFLLRGNSTFPALVITTWHWNYTLCRTSRMLARISRLR